MATTDDNRHTYILIAEDERSVREFVTRGLQSAHYHVTVAEDGQQALEKLAEPPPGAPEGTPYDLLLTDIVMPHLDGISLALTATRNNPDLKIIMMSGYADARAKAHNLEALIHFVMAKPFSLQELLEQVKAALTKS